MMIARKVSQNANPFPLLAGDEGVGCGCCDTASVSVLDIVSLVVGLATDLPFRHTLYVYAFRSLLLRFC